MARRPPAAVLFDRDGTLVEDVPYNTDPGAVRPMPGARRALEILRRHGIPTGVVTNQSGVGRGLLGLDDVHRINARIERLLGPLGVWAICPHRPDDGCGCRKPAPGLLFEAAGKLGVQPKDCLVIGDIGADMAAAHTAGALGILVPTPRTRAAEIRDAPLVAPDPCAAVLASLPVRHPGGL